MAPLRYTGILVFALLFLAPAGIAGKTSDTHLEILGISIPEQGLHCVKQFTLFTDIQNTGKTDEYVTIQLLNQVLGINEVSPLSLLEAGRISTTTFMISLPEEPKGTYEVEILVTAGQKITRLFKSFTFAGCEQETERQIMPKPVFSPEVTAKQPEQETMFSIPMVATALLVSILVFLIIIYLIHQAREA